MSKKLMMSPFATCDCIILTVEGSIILRMLAELTGLHSHKRKITSFIAPQYEFWKCEIRTTGILVNKQGDPEACSPGNVGREK